MDQIALRNLSPANFAFVMSSGAVSIVFHITGWLNLSLLFLIVGFLGYAALILLFVGRLFVLKMEVLQDFKDIQKMFKYLTFSAGSCSLAISCCLSGYNLAGLILGTVGVTSTILLTYVLFCTLFFHIQVPIQAISPFWLLLTIACHSSGIVIVMLWKNGMLSGTPFLLLAFGFWTFGFFLYMIFMTLNIYRMLFFPFNGRDMDPCYWTCMGAAAIAVVDGSQLILLDNAPYFLDAVKPFMEGMVLFLWGWGTAWIPILCLMELWKAIYFKVPFHYQPSLWAMVFPQGMYTTATFWLAASLHLDVLHGIVHLWLWITFLMWCLVAYMSRLNPFSHSNINMLSK